MGWYYGSMKKYIVGFLLTFVFAFSVHAATPLTGKTIALDAGHGTSITDTGATGICSGTTVTATEVNLAVRSELKALIESGGGSVHLVAQVPKRSDRVADAEAANSDVLISIHHDGSPRNSADSTRSFVTQRNDVVFAGFVHPQIVSALGLQDEGIKNDGYGITVYGSLPGILSEAYSVASSAAACDYIDYINGATSTRVQKEAQAMYDGLVAYFTANPTNSTKGKSR